MLSDIQKRLFPLFLVIFIDSFGFLLVIPIFAHLFLSSDHVFFPALSETCRNVIFGVTIGLSPLASLISHPAIGAWSDKWGRKFTLMTCLVLSSLGFLCLYLAVILHWFSLILFGRFISGFAYASQPIAQAAVTDLCHYRDKTLNLGLIAFAMTLAMVLGPVLGGLLSNPDLVSWFDDSTPFACALILSLINLWLLHVNFHETHQTTHDHMSWKEIIHTLTQIGKDPTVRLLLIAFFAYEFAWSLYFQSSPLWLVNDYHFSSGKIAIFLSVIGFWMSLGLTVILSFLIRHISAAYLFFYSLLIAGITLVIFCFFKAIWVEWVGIIPLSIATGIAYPCLLTLLSNHTKTVHQGWIMGVASAFMAGSWLTSSLLAGLIYSISVNWPFYIAAIGYLLGACLLLFKMLKNKHDLKPDS